jgi:hypothetical protein
LTLPMVNVASTSGGSEPSIVLSIPTVIFNVRARAVDIPVQVSHVTGNGVVNANLIIVYDPNVLTAKDVTLGDGIARNSTLAANLDEAGIIRLGLISASPLSGSGTLVTLHFDIKSVPPTGRSPLTWMQASLNAGAIPTTARSGDLAAAATAPLPPTNRAPSAFGQTLSTAEDTPLAITLTGSDLDGDTLLFLLTSQPASGSLNGNPPHLTYTPNRDFFGQDNFRFKVDDGLHGGGEAIVTIHVDGVNDAPHPDAGEEMTVNAGESVQLDGGRSRDPEGEPLAFRWATDGLTLTGEKPTFIAPDNVDRLTLTLTVTDSGGLTATDTVTIAILPVYEAEFTLVVPEGIGFIHFPLAVGEVNGRTMSIRTVGDFYAALGGEENVNFIVAYHAERRQWVSYLGEASRGTLADHPITPEMGVITVTKRSTMLRLKGHGFDDSGRVTIHLLPGLNLIGLPMNDSRLKTVSDLFNLEGFSGNLLSIVVLDPADGQFKVFARAGDAGDIPIAGGTALLVIAKRETTAEVAGRLWKNEAVSAAPTPFGYRAGHWTPILEIHGAIRNFTAQDLSSGLRVAIRNRSTGATQTTGVNAEDIFKGYSVTLVNPRWGHAAQTGDVLEIIVESPQPQVSVQTLPYTVRAEDIRSSQVQLPDLMMERVPTETKLLPNFPNPFNPETWIPYELAQDASVSVDIYNATGQFVRSIALGFQARGRYVSPEKAAYWDGRNQFGEKVASGVYFYVLNAGDYSETRKLVIAK